VAYFNRHLVAFDLLLYPFSTVANRINVSCICVHYLWLPQWRRHWDATGVTRARLKQPFSFYRALKYF